MMHVLYSLLRFMHCALACGEPRKRPGLQSALEKRAPLTPSPRPISGTLALVGTLLFAAPVIAHRHRDPSVGTASQARSAVRLGLEQALPNRRLTPGAVDPKIVQSDIGQTICVRGYTRSIRPPEAYTERLKRAQIRQYGYADRRLRDYEEDHLVSLELGGSPTSARNLWPEPRHVIGGWGSRAKDRLENRLHALVCRGRLPLAQAQREIARDWIRAYKRYIAAAPRHRGGLDGADTRSSGQSPRLRGARRGAEYDHCARCRTQLCVYELGYRQSASAGEACAR